jgi:predicted nucleic acid-binding Zn ribbon protein
MSKDSSKKCPKCGKRKGRRRISGGGGFIFKGPGFYSTDYRKGSKGKKE